MEKLKRFYVFLENWLRFIWWDYFLPVNPESFAPAIDWAIKQKINNFNFILSNSKRQRELSNQPTNE